MTPKDQQLNASILKPWQIPQELPFALGKKGWSQAIQSFSGPFAAQGVLHELSAQLRKIEMLILLERGRDALNQNRSRDICTMTRHVHILRAVLGRKDS